MIIITSPSKEMDDQAIMSTQEFTFKEFVNETIGDKGLKDDTNTYSALSLYNGLQFRYLKDGLDKEHFEFLENYLRILSARYGVLRPMDGIQPYRLDFQHKGMYKVWEDKIYSDLVEEDKVILNLASKEYSKTVERYLDDNISLIDVEFHEQTADGELKKHSTISKKGRGSLVNYLAKVGQVDWDTIKSFTGMNYRLSEEQSSDRTLVFIRPKD